MTKETDSPLDPKVLLQSIEPGSLIPISIIDPFDQDKSGLFLLNFSKYINNDIWGDYGDQELAQAEKLRSFAAHVVALANAMEELGHHLKSYPDRDEFEFGDYEQSLEQIGEEMNTTLESGYRKLQSLLADLAEAAVGDYMD
jgi:hypothetical protein